MLAVACSGAGLQGPERKGGDVPESTTSKGLQETSAAEENDARAAAIARGATLYDDPVPERLTYGWETNFAVHSVPFSEIVSGGPPRDGIPPIDNPVFFVAADAPHYVRDDEPVIALEINGTAKAYTLAMLIRHEIVNDALAARLSNR